MPRINSGIMFTPEHVQLIRLGRKTQTRRVVKRPTPVEWCPYGRQDWVLKVKSNYFMSVKPELLIRVKAIRAEPLQDITEDDARAEGVSCVGRYREVWEKINAKRGFPWETNPLVWVIEFEKVGGQ